MKKILLSAGLCAAIPFMLQGCLQESRDTDDSGAAANPFPLEEEYQVEEAFPGKTGVKASGYFLGQYIEYEIIEGRNVWQGDIIIPDADITHSPQPLTKESGAGRTSSSRKWTTLVVPYTISSTLPDQARVTTALDFWSYKFKFVPRTNETAYIHFQDDGSGCNSPYGRQGGKQNINLASGCSTGSTIHEVGHSLGLFHEMSRSDRNSWVTINWNNIESGKSHNFQTYSEMGLDGFDFLTFDFNSLMMYGSTDFGKVVNGVKQTTITAVSGQTWTTNRTGPAMSDMRTIEAMYPAANPTWTGVAAHSGTNLDVVVARGDGTIHTAAWDPFVSNGAWRGWWSIQSGKTSPGGPVTMVARGTNKLDVFANGTDNRVYTAAWDHFVSNGVWRGWWVLGNLTTWPGSVIVPTARQLGKMEVFAVDRSGRVQVAVWDTNLPNGGWKEWAPLLGGIAISGGQLTAVASSSSRIDVYTIGTDGNAYQAYFDGTNWNGWFSIGNPGVRLTDIQLVARSGGKFDVFAVGLNRGIYHRAWNNGWSSWSRILNGTAAAGSRIAAVSRNASTLDIFAIGTDNWIYTAAKVDGGSWGGWWALNGAARPGSQLSAISRGTDKLDVFTTGTDGATWHNAWDGTVSGNWKGWVRLP